MNMSNKPYFVQRLSAFILDVILDSFVASLVVSPFLDTDSITKLQESSAELSQEYVNKEISTMTFFTEYKTLAFENAKKTGLLSIITVLFDISYFVVLQFYFKGQTIGKKITKIRVENIEGDLTINNLVFRSLIINSLFCNMVSLCFMVSGNADVYFFGSITFELINIMLLTICGFMVMFGKSGRGLHDYLGHTRVVRTNLVEEKELCES